MAFDKGVLAHFRDYDCSWHITSYVKDPSNTTIESLNRTIGQIARSFSNEDDDKARFIYHEGNILNFDTRVEDLLIPGQKEVTFYFIWDADYEAFIESGRFIWDLNSNNNLYRTEDYNSLPIKLPIPPPDIPEQIFYGIGDDSPPFSLCIPRVFPNINKNRIRTIFNKLSYPEIEDIDLVTCQGKDKKSGLPQDYNRVFIHFKSMSGSDQTENIRNNLRMIFNGEQVKIVYDTPWYWLVSMSYSMRPTKREIISEKEQPSIDWTTPDVNILSQDDFNSYNIYGNSIW